MKPAFPLTTTPPGKDVVLVYIFGGRGLRAKLTDMGLNEGIKIKVLQCGRGGPCVVLFHNTRLALGYGISQKIMVSEE
jgi:Fe2+ transport system protein FeoA